MQVARLRSRHGPVLCGVLFCVLASSWVSLAPWMVSVLIVAIRTTRTSLLDRSLVVASSNKSLARVGSSTLVMMACCQLCMPVMIFAEQAVESQGAEPKAAEATEAVVALGRLFAAFLLLPLEAGQEVSLVE